MKAFFFLFAFGLFSLPSLAQEVRLFNKNFQKHTTDSSSRNIRLYYLGAEPATIKDYRGDTLQMLASVYGVKTVKETDALLWYYKKRRFENGLNPIFYKKSIQLISFDKKGKPLNKLNCRDHKIYYEQVWDENGDELLLNGSGIHSFLDKRSGEQIREIFLDSLLVEKWGIRPEQQDTIYYHYDKAPQPRGGMQRFYQNLKKNLEYPKRARLSQKEGTVYIQLIIDKDGQLTEFTPLSENGYNMEANVLKVLKRFRPWQPAIFQGKAVKSKLIVPVHFES